MMLNMNFSLVSASAKNQSQSIASACPLVSVIIPTYNGTRHIEETLGSVFTQEYPSWEVIVVNDGSTDHIQEVLERYRDRVHHIEQANQGTAAARNRELKSALGELVVFLDHDDLLLPDALADRVESFQRYPSMGMVASGWRQIDEHGQTIGNHEPWRDAPNLTLEDWLPWSPVLPSAMMFRRTWLERAGGFDAAVSGSDDTDLVWRLALMGCQADWVKKMSICYRVHSTNQSRLRPEIIETHLNVVEKFFSQPDLPTRVRNLESHVRYYFLLWHIWNLYCSGHTEAMVPYLQQVLNVSPFFSPEATVFNWATYFVRLFLERNYPETEIYSVLPYFRKAITLNTSQWMEIEWVLRLWMDVWHRYWNQAEPPSNPYTFPLLHRMPPEDIVESFQRYSHLPNWFLSVISPGYGKIFDNTA